MSMKYGLLSLLALCLCLFAIFKSVAVWTYPLDQVSDNVIGKKLEEKPKAPPAIEAQKNPNSVRPPILIAEKNIFSPERKDFPIVSVESSSVNVRPQVILYGVTIAGNFQAASITSPGRPLLKGERETLTLKVGEKIGQYKLAKVLPDRIRFQNTNDSFEVLLYDPKKSKKKIEMIAEANPPAVTSPSPPTPAVSQPSPGVPPASLPPQDAIEKPKEPVRQQVTPLPTGPQPPLPYFARPNVIRGRRPMYFPQTGAPMQEPTAN